ncbi:MAG: phosphate ABC transporter permease subunit PstC [Faecalibacterium sp.]
MKRTAFSALRRHPRTAAEVFETGMQILFFLCGILAVGCVILITVYIVAAGLPALRQIGLKEFLFGTRWASTAAEPAFGILPFLLSSVLGTLGAALLGVPVGVLTAVFLSKAAPPRARSVAVSAVELLSGIPSVVFGLLGMQILVPAVAKVFGLASGACLLSAVIVLAIMILPSIVSVSVTALDAVPPEYEQGSLALGATWEETWFRVSLPAAKSGIAAGIVLGIGRAVGEAMAVMMVAGNSPNMPGLFKSVTFLTTAIAKEMSYASGLQKQALFSIALVLFLFIMGINLLLNWVLKGGKRREK